jgi:hypothetical protein
VIAACADASRPEGGSYVSATRVEGRPLSRLVISLCTEAEWLPQDIPVAVIFVTDRGAAPDAVQASARILPLQKLNTLRCFMLRL